MADTPTKIEMEPDDPAIWRQAVKAMLQSSRVHCYCDFRPLRRQPGPLRIVCEGVPELVGA